MNFFQRGGRARFVLLLLVLTAVSLMTLDGRDLGPVGSARSATVSVLSPFRSVTGWLLSPIGNIWNGVTNYSDLEEENAALQQQIAELEGNEIRETTALATLDRFLRDTEIDFGADVPQVTGRVISGPATPFEATVTIDKGTKQGIQEGMAVVTGSGLVGRIERASGSESVVLLLTDARVKVGSRIVSSQALGRIEGRGIGRLPVVEVSGDVELVPGDILQTSGLSGSAYPPGVPIGRVVGVPGEDELPVTDETDDDPSQDDTTATATGGLSVLPIQPVTMTRAEVELSARLDRLNFLTVLLWVP